MSEKRSFWSTIPGLVTGLAGLLTGIVGLITVLIQLGVLGGKSDSGSTPPAKNGTVTTAPATAGPSATSGASGTLAAAGSFTVPSTLDFPAGVKEKTLAVKNTSSSGTITVRPPTVTGSDAARFTVALGDCSQPLAANLSCTMTVTFSPNGALRTYSAALELTATGAERGSEVALTATTLL